MVKFCSECGFENKDDAQFCKKCGSSLQGNIKTADNKSKSNKNTLIIGVVVLIAILAIAGAYVYLNNNSNGTTNNETNVTVEETIPGVNFDEACSYFSDASSTVVGHVFDESDIDGDGYLSDTEYGNFKDLVVFTRKYAFDISNNDEVNTPDLWNGDGSIRTRYCADHGRVAVGSDDRCSYCEQKGLDSRTRSGSTKYV